MNPANANDVDAAANPQMLNYQSPQCHIKTSTVSSPAGTPYKQHGSNGDASLNGTPLHNGHGNANGTNGYQNGTRRDSTQAWTPLLPSGNGNNAALTNGNGNAGLTDKQPQVGTASINGAEDASLAVKEANETLGDPTTVLYTTSTSNNNEWKDAEQIKNLKNGLLHYPVNHQGNNNGSLMNGKNGIGLGVPDKYDEQDPLTGLYAQKNTRTRERDESDTDSELSNGDRQAPGCGLFGCRPKWARNFASTNIFMVVFLLAYILQGMYMTYFVSVITTIEKLFQIKSKTTGFLLSASEMGQISTAMLLTYFAGRGHRPRWIACGMVLFSIAAFACSLPHFIFGKQLMQSLDTLSNGGNDGNAAMRTLHGQMLHTSYGLHGMNDTKNTTSANTLEGGLSALLGNMQGAHEMNLCIPGQNSTNFNSGKFAKNIYIYKC